MLHRARIEESYAAPLVCAVQAHAALRRNDITAVRQELVSAQRLRHLLTYAMPQFAVQARIHLASAHLALGDLAGAKTLMQEIDELLSLCPAWEPWPTRLTRSGRGSQHSAPRASPRPRL